MNPQVGEFALIILIGVVKMGFIGVAGFGFGWWLSNRRLERLRGPLPDTDRIEERLANLERSTDYAASQMDRLLEGQEALVEHLAALPPAGRFERVDRTPPH